ncbi:hypothetical protein [Geomobilimonas luticola]|uniref:Uncharacterized protein n=1 Tax=Geomobilimonas luticola TaxID=1114878 RepID=A0ABS5SFU6_9BACT|nr:hypothetical protein [Geomobilimonas luticola]MBT0653384.1 hypothetical protein [Geomobilimonas luticola]
MHNEGKPVGSYGRIVAALQIVIVGLIVGFATVQLFLGNFAAAMATFPLLVVYWFFLTVWKKQS